MDCFVDSNLLVSVIIPVYNAEKFIDVCIESVLKQSYKNLDVIIVNDGSTDDSANKCRQYCSDVRVRFIDRENRGLSATRQEGIDISRGDYFCTIDADDFIEPFFIQVLLDRITKFNADVCVCKTYKYGDARKEVECQFFSHEYYRNSVSDVESNICNLSRELRLSDSWGKLYRTKFVKDTGVRFFMEKGCIGNDLAFNHLLFLHNPIFCSVDTPLYYQRINANSMTRQGNSPMKERFDIIFQKVLLESKKLGYGVSFYDNYSKIIGRLQVVAFFKLIKFSNSFSIFIKNKNIFYKRYESFFRNAPEFHKYDGKLFPQKIISILLRRSIFQNDTVASSILFTIFKIKFFVSNKE